MAKKVKVQLSDQEREAKREERKRVNRERFIKLAEPRVNKLLKAMGHVENMASRNGYEYTSEEATLIVGAVTNALVSMKRAFDGTANGKTGFTLKA